MEMIINKWQSIVLALGFPAFVLRFLDSEKLNAEVGQSTKIKFKFHRLGLDVILLFYTNLKIAMGIKVGMFIY